jgi:plastocyanin
MLVSSGIVLFPACADRPREPPPEPVILDLDGDTVRLAPGAVIVDIAVATAPGRSEFDPGAAPLRGGDVVRFRAGDAGPHALVMDAESSDAAARGFLEQSGQSRGLPFLQPGAIWVVSFAGAPSGTYVVRCLVHGGAARIVVAAPATGRQR